MNNPSKSWQLSIIVAGLVAILSSIAMGYNAGIVISIVFSFALWLSFGYIESKPTLKEKIKEVFRLN